MVSGPDHQAPTSSPHVTPSKPSRTAAEALTISLPGVTIRQARIIAAANGTSISKLIAGLLDEAIEREMPEIVRGLRGAAE